MDATIANFLAEITARSLVNRIHYSINFTNSIKSFTNSVLGEASTYNDHSSAAVLSSLVKICNELTRQLETWYDSLPLNIKPNLVPDIPGENSRTCLLRCRYWSSMNKIHRPFILKTISSPLDQQIPAELLEKCNKCIVSCRMFLKSVGGLLAERSPYVYTASHG